MDPSKLQVYGATFCVRVGQKKISHPSRAQAKRHLKQLQRDKNYAGSVYQCPHCQGWHVGKSMFDVDNR